MEFDDLRKLDDDQSPFEDDDFEELTSGISSDDQLFLGMTPLERMFLSIFLFMNVTVFGLALLLATDRIG
jgi:hypothetical protein